MNVPNSLTELSDLAVLPTASLLLHETHDPARLDALKHRVTDDGVQTNPIIASRVPRPEPSSTEPLSAESPDRFLVLDGAHRAETLRVLGYRFALVQLVDLPPYAEGWRHLVSGAGSLSGFRENGDEEMTVARVLTGDGVGFGITAGSEAGRAAVLRRIHALYPNGGDGVVRRLAAGEEVAPGEGEAVVAYSPFPTGGIVAEVLAGRALPAGVTRFTVPGRILGVRMPLGLLLEEEAQKAAAWLRERIERRLAENRIRRYEEPVTLFE